MRFDGYCGNVRGHTAEQVAEVIAFGCKARIERGKGRRRYSDVFEVRDGNLGLGWVGTDAALGAAYFEFKGVSTPHAVATVRKHWPAPEHTVSRLDPCEDFNERGAFDRLVQLVDAHADPRVKSKIIAPRNTNDGRTVYWGGRQSQGMVRVYEAGLMPERLHFGKPDWTRIEAEMHPHKPLLKLAAASVSPVDAWGLAGWTQRVAEHLCQVDVQRLAVSQDPPRFDKTTLYLARQFRRHWEQMLEDYGDAECIFREIREIWRLDDESQEIGGHA
jgi:hypothetical protein